MKRKRPEGWEWKRLGTLARIDSGGTPSRGNVQYWEGGNIPWVKISDIKEKYIAKTSERITTEGLQNSSAKLFPKGTILISIFATIGDVGILKIEACCNQALAGIQLIDYSIDQDYLYYYLKNIKIHIESLGRGVAQNNINLSILKNMDIIVPPIETQRRIVAILDKAEETRRLQAQSDDLAGKLIQSVFLEMFGDPIKNLKGWSLKALDSVCDEIYRYPTFYGFKYVPEGIPVLKISNMNKDKDGTFMDDINIYDKVSNDINEKYPRTIVKEGDIVMEARGTYIGTCAIVTKKLEGSNISPNTIRISPSRDKILPHFLLYISLTNAWKKEIETRVRYWKAGFGTIKSSELKNLKILCPPIQLQNQFVESFDCYKRLQQSQRGAQQNIDDLFGVLMQKAFSGELVA